MLSPDIMLWKLKAEKVEAKLAEAQAWADTMLRNIEVLEAQIAEQGFIIQQTQIDRDTWRSNYHEVAAQIAAKDAALDALDEAHQITQQNLWRDITELRASLAGKEQEHQDFRLQNDAEWRAKLDHLKAQIAAKDAALRECLLWFDNSDLPKSDMQMIAMIRAALNAPTGETDT